MGNFTPGPFVNHSGAPEMRSRVTSPMSAGSIVAKRSDVESTARDVFEAIRGGVLDANISYEYPLEDAVKAHEALESGTTLGATVLIP